MRRQRGENDDSMLEGNDSDESYGSTSEATEFDGLEEPSEAETGIADSLPTQTPAISQQTRDTFDRKKKSGRMSAQLDPDAL